MSSTMLVQMDLKGADKITSGLRTLSVEIRQLRAALNQIGAQSAAAATNVKALASSFASATTQAKSAAAAINRVPNAGGGRGRGQADPLKNWIYSMRYGGGGSMGGMMPLVGRTMDVMGMGGLTVSAGIAGMALSALGKAAQFATEHLGMLGNAGAIGGGLPGDVGRAGATGNAFGRNAEQVAIDARAVLDRMRSDPLAKGVGASAGVQVNNQAYFDTQNVFPRFQKLLDNIIFNAGKSREQKIREWRQIGGPDEYLRGIDAPESLKRAIRNGAGGPFAPSSKMQGDMAEQDYQAGKTKDIFAGAIDAIGFGVKRVAAWIGRGLGESGALIPNNAKPGAMPGTPNMRAERAQDRMTDAMELLAQEMKAYRRTVGGGESAKGAIPGGWRYQQMDQALQAQAAALGAFGL